MYKNNFVKIGLIQLSVSKDIDANLRVAAESVEEAAKQGAKIICLPELYSTIYFPQYIDINKDIFTETIPGKSTDIFSRIAKKYGVVIIVPIYEKSADNKYFNTAVVINADGFILGTYRKIHIPHDPCFYEQDYFDAVDDNYQVFKTEYCNFSVLICYDQWFPEAARIVALKGADLIFYPTAIGVIDENNCKDGDWQNSWETVMRGHSIANGIHVAAVNRVGRENKLNFWGGSFVCNAFGKILDRAAFEKPQIIVSEIDLSHNDLIKDGWGFFRNRRPDTYSKLVE